MSGSYELHQPASHPTSPPLIPEESPPFSRLTGGSPTANGDGPVGATSMTKTGWVRTSASMNPNLYATKKTLAQGMLDVALLSVNATQLKTIIQRGDEHDFYTVLVVLISLSIALQILVGMVFLVLGFVNLNKDKNHRMAEILNNVATAAVFAVTVLNILTASFDSRSNDGTNFQRRPNQAQPLVPR